MTRKHRLKLAYQHVDIDVSCSLCNDGRDSINHCLVECPLAQVCWARTGIGVCTTVRGTFSAWLEALYERFDDEQRNLIAMKCWVLWRVRNDSVWKGKTAKASIVLVLDKSSLDQWTKAQDKFEVPKCAFLSSEDGAERWIKPADGAIKINIDAAIFYDSSLYSFACVAKDHRGQVIEDITCCKQGVVAPELTEAMRMRETLSWIKKKSWNKVTIETDCVTVIQALRSPFHMDSYFGGLIDECKNLRDDVSADSILFIKRSANSVAHVIARVFYFVADRTIRSDDFTLTILDVIWKDIH